MSLCKVLPSYTFAPHTNTLVLFLLPGAWRLELLSVPSRSARSSLIPPYFPPSLACLAPYMASRSPSLTQDARDSAPGTPEAGGGGGGGAASQLSPEVFCKLCLSEQPSAATRELQSCNCRFCTAVSRDLISAFQIFTY